MKKLSVIDKLLPFELSALADDKPSLDIDLSSGTTSKEFVCETPKNLTPGYLAECLEASSENYIFRPRYNYVFTVSQQEYEWIMKTPEEWEELLRHCPGVPPREIVSTEDDEI